MVSPVPQQNKTDPIAIPIKGCSPAETIEIQLTPTPSSELKVETSNSAECMVFFMYDPAGPTKNDGSVPHDAVTPSSSYPNGYFPPAFEAVDKQVAKGQVKQYIIKQDYKPKVGAAKGMTFTPIAGTKYIGFIGMGAKDTSVNKEANTVAESFYQMMKEQKPASVEIVIPENVPIKYMKVFFETFFTISSPHTAYFSNPEKSKPPYPFNKIFVSYNPKIGPQFKAAVAQAKAVAQGTYFAQELVTAPPNYCNTVSFANAVAEMAKEAGMPCKVYEQSEMEEMKMGGILAVGKGSMFPPKMVHVTYTPEGGATKKIAFVGKGIVFDSGGYNIKSAASMIEFMKMDMGGAAAVFGAAKAISIIKPSDTEIHFIAPMAENMVSQTSYRPGDVVTISNGKTVEVTNTDAEGRMILSDALVYAESLGVNCIVDFATLTGASMIALGLKIAAVYSNNDKAGEAFIKAAENAGEKVAPIPLHMEYNEILDSKIADMLNAPSNAGRGGSIIAALFLNRFINQTPWVHVDMAGPALNYETGAGTGFGVKSAVEFACTQP